MTVAIVGYGYVGKAYNKMFPDAVIYDEPQKLCVTSGTFPAGIPSTITDRGHLKLKADSNEIWLQDARQSVNECDMAIVCVPTDLQTRMTQGYIKDSHISLDGKNLNATAIPTKTKSYLDMSIVEEVVDWLETPLILIKSALQPGTVDRLVKETGKKIAVSVEMVGEGKYYVPDHKYPHATDPTRHDFLIVGGEKETAEACANVLWSKMSPDINIHLTTAIEAEITKMMENTWGAMKVTFANVMYDICQEYGASYIDVLQAWGSDGRTEKMHMRVNPNKRGWKSKCYDKDVPALAEIDKSGFLNKLVEVNKSHVKDPS